MSSLVGVCLVTHGLVPIISGYVLRALGVSGSVPLDGVFWRLNPFWLYRSFGPTTLLIRPILDDRFEGKDPERVLSVVSLSICPSEDSEQILM